MKIWTAASWGEKCFSSEAFLESKALKLMNIHAHSLTLNVAAFGQVSYATASVLAHRCSTQLGQPLALQQQGTNQHS